VFRLLAFDNQFLLVPFTQFDVELKELLLSHVVELSENRQIDRIGQIIGAENALPCLPLEVSLSVQALTLN